MSKIYSYGGDNGRRPSGVKASGSKKQNQIDYTINPELINYITRFQRQQQLKNEQQIQLCSFEN